MKTGNPNIRDIAAKKGEKRNEKFLSESQIRWAMEHAKSASAVARFLRVSLNTLKKYAIQYYDNKSGKNLYETMKNPGGEGIRKTSLSTLKTNFYKKSQLMFIINGKKKNTYHGNYFLEKILRNKLMPDICCRCGFSERRVTDNKVPLKIVFKDGNRENGELSNLELVCFNCYFLTEGNVAGRQPVFYTVR